MLSSGASSKSSTTGSSRVQKGTALAAPASRSAQRLPRRASSQEPSGVRRVKASRKTRPTSASLSSSRTSSAGTRRDLAGEEDSALTPSAEELPVSGTGLSSEEEEKERSDWETGSLLCQPPPNEAGALAASRSCADAVSVETAEQEQAEATRGEKEKREFGEGVSLSCDGKDCCSSSPRRNNLQEAAFRGTCARTLAESLSAAHHAAAAAATPRRTFPIYFELSPFCSETAALSVEEETQGPVLSQPPASGDGFAGRDSASAAARAKASREGDSSPSASLWLSLEAAERRHPASVCCWPSEDAAENSAFSLRVKENLQTPSRATQQQRLRRSEEASCSFGDEAVKTASEQVGNAAHSTDSLRREDARESGLGGEVHSSRGLVERGAEANSVVPEGEAEKAGVFGGQRRGSASHQGPPLPSDDALNSLDRELLALQRNSVRGFSRGRRLPPALDGAAVFTARIPFSLRFSSSPDDSRSAR